MRLIIIFTLIFSSVLGQNYTWPTDVGKNLSSNFGEFRTTGYHLGLDIKTKGTTGHPIYAVDDGIISRIVTNYSGFGKALYLTMEDEKTAVYAHLSKFSDKLEKRLKEEQEKSQSYLTNFYLTPNEFPFIQNDIIAYSGNSGFSFGPHLHFEIRDEKGMIFPGPVAPYQVHLVGLNLNDETVSAAAEQLYQELWNLGVETLYDDRVDQAPGVKFNDADLIGIPIRIVVSNRNLKNNVFEIKRRCDEKGSLVPREVIEASVNEMLSSLEV